MVSMNEIMKKMKKDENNDSFKRDKNIVRAVDGKRKSHCVWPKQYFHVCTTIEREREREGERGD